MALKDFGDEIFDIRMIGRVAQFKAGLYPGKFFKRHTWHDNIPDMTPYDIHVFRIVKFEPFVFTEHGKRFGYILDDIQQTCIREFGGSPLAHQRRLDRLSFTDVVGDNHGRGIAPPRDRYHRRAHMKVRAIHTAHQEFLRRRRYAL